MTLIIPNVSRHQALKNGRLSASGSFPRSIAIALKKTRSATIFEALKQGLEDRRITVSRRATKEAKHTATALHWHPKSRNPRLARGAGF